MGIPLRHYHEGMERRATNPDEAFWAFDPFAIVDPASPRYVDLESLLPREHYGLGSSLAKYLTPSDARHKHVQVGLIGHKGSGKSTQVRHALHGLKDKGVLPVFVDVVAELDQSDLEFTELVFVAIRRTLDAVKEAGIEVSREAASSLWKWFDDEVITLLDSTELGSEIKSGVEGKAGIPGFIKVFARLSSQFRQNTETKKEIRRHLTRDPADLISRINALLDGFVALPGETSKKDNPKPKSLCIVFDNLEKVTDREQVENAVLRRSDDWKRLHADLLFFFDPSDQYFPKRVRVGDVFPVIKVPMLPVRKKGDPLSTVSKQTVEAISILIERRVDPDRVFEDPLQAARFLARYSGGRLRDVFSLARVACEAAGTRLVSLRNLKGTLPRLCSELSTPVRPEQWARLAVIHATKQVTNLEDDAYLLLHSAVLDYDGEPWWDVHPLVAFDERFPTPSKPPRKRRKAT